MFGQETGQPQNQDFVKGVVFLEAAAAAPFVLYDDIKKSQGLSCLCRSHQKMTDFNWWPAMRVIKIACTSTLRAHHGLRCSCLRRGPWDRTGRDFRLNLRGGCGGSARFHSRRVNRISPVGLAETVWTSSFKCREMLRAFSRSARNSVSQSLRGPSTVLLFNDAGSRGIYRPS